MIRFYKEWRSNFIGKNEIEIYETIILGKRWVFESLKELEEFDEIVGWKDYSSIYPKRKDCHFPLLVEVNFNREGKIIRYPLPFHRIIRTIHDFVDYFKYLKLEQILTHEDAGLRKFIREMLKLVSTCDDLKEAENNCNLEMSQLLEFVLSMRNKE